MDQPEKGILFMSYILQRKFVRGVEKVNFSMSYILKQSILRSLLFHEQAYHTKSPFRMFQIAESPVSARWQAPEQPGGTDTGDPVPGPIGFLAIYSISTWIMTEGPLPLIS